MAKTILVVDDEPNIVTLVGSRLVASGYDVLIATNGASAVRKCKTYLPHALVLDIMMPDMDGSTVAAALKDDPRTRNIPIVFLTALLRKGEVPVVPDVAGNYFLPKPFRGDELVDLLDQILN